MKTSHIIPVIALSLLLPLQFSCTQATETVPSSPIANNPNVLPPSQPVVSESSLKVRPRHMARAGEGGVVTCGIEPAYSSNNNE